MVAQKELKIEKSPRSVIRGRNSQNQNQTGIHWLRNQLPRQYIKRVRAYCDHYFGESSKDGYGLWSYDTRYVWRNGATLSFDADPERSLAVHNGKCTLEVPGKPIDTMNRDNLRLFLCGLRDFSPVCTRIDIFFDDFNRSMTPTRLGKIVKKGHYSRFRQVHFRQTGEYKNGDFVLDHDEIDFGRRGQNGSGKYLRVYDKNLESKGEKDCIRWEVEFSKERAIKAFDELSQAADTDCLAALCGSYIGGSITFVHRNGDKNIARLVVYKFWSEIQKTLGDLMIRVEKKFSDIAGMYQWLRSQVSATLATLRATFMNEVDYANFLFDVIADGELKMSQRQMNLAKANKRHILYSNGKIFDNDGVLLI